MLPMDQPKRQKKIYQLKRTPIRKKSNSPAAKKKQAEELVRRKNLGVFFADQVLQMPANCENCGKPITMRGRAAVCHIVPKEFYRTVELHPQNRWFGCLPCHDQFDGKGAASKRIEDMPVITLVVERFKEFMHLLTREEVRRLPGFLAEVYERTKVNPKG
jgi:5-methylcytosine-specific restriction endonuclease McrA